MTKDEAARHKAWIILHAGGTPLQVWSKRDLCWYDSPNPSFRLNCVYRVKPIEPIDDEITQSATVCKELIYYFKQGNTEVEDIKNSFTFQVLWEPCRKYYQANKG